MHDGSRAHITADVRYFLHTIYPQRWIGCGGSVTWPTRSADLNQIDFFNWGHMKSFTYQSPVDSSEGLAARIIAAADKISATPGTFERMR